jgi:hypothetical protein
MSARRWPFALFCLLCLLAGTHAQEPAYSAVVLHRHDQPAGFGFTTAVLAPDGSRYAYLGSGRGLCVFEIDGTELGCVDIEPVRSLDIRSLRWSPDSRYIAMTQNFLTYFVDADIWVADTEAMLLNNVTPDSVDRLDLNDDDWPGYQDMAPTWLADGRLVFARAQREAGAFTTTLYSALPDGADLAPIPGAAFEGLMPYMLAAASQAPTLAYNVERRDDEIFGVDMLRLTDNTATPLLRTDARNRALEMRLSPDGNYLVMVDEQAMILRESISYMATDTVGAKLLRLPAAGSITGAAFAPDSSAIAYLVSEAEDSETNGLYVKPLPDGEPQQVLRGSFRSPLNASYLFLWEGSAVLLFDHSSGELVVVRLEAAGS